MKEKHYEELKEIMKYGFSINTRLKDKYKKHGWSDMQYTWDVFDTCVPDAFYIMLKNYLNDKDINSALLKIIDEI